MIFTYYRRPLKFYLIEVEDMPVQMKYDYYFKLVSKFENDFQVPSVAGGSVGAEIVNPFTALSSTRRGDGVRKAHFSMSQAIRHLIKQIYEEN